MESRLPTGGEDLAMLEDQLAHYDGPDQMISSHELAEQLAQLTPQPQLKTGVPSLDRILDNTEAGELVIVSGPTGGGKTTLLQTITHSMQDYAPAWFTLEVTAQQLFKKLGEPLPLFYLPARNTENHVKWLLERIIEAKVKYDTKVVFVDHLHQIFSLDRFAGKNLSLEIGDIVAKIKQIALQYQLVIFLVAHNTDNKASNAEPRMTDIRDSGMISRLADSVIGVWRIKNGQSSEVKTMQELSEQDTWAKVRVWKNRRQGTLGGFTMNHINHKLVEIDAVFAEPVQKKLTAEEQYEQYAKN